MTIRLANILIIGTLIFASNEVLAAKYGYLILDAISLEGEHPKTIWLARTGISTPRSDVIQFDTGKPFIKLEVGCYKFLRIDFSEKSTLESNRPIATDIEFFYSSRQH